MLFVILKEPLVKVFFKSDPDLSVSIYCDADWGSCPLSRFSLTSYVFLLGGSPVSWKTKKQYTLSHSSVEAEYRAVFLATNEIHWVRHLFGELGFIDLKPVQMFYDSEVAIHIAANPVFHERTNHVEIDCHNVCDAVQAGQLVTIHVHTSEQVAYLLTKALDCAQFNYLLSKKLGVHNLHALT